MNIPTPPLKNKTNKPFNRMEDFKAQWMYSLTVFISRQDFS